MTLNGIPTSVLLAPDKFKGTFSAAQVATALALGLRARGHAADLCPVADGGEGTLDALQAALGLERLEVQVSDPLGRRTPATFGLADGGAAVIEMAASSGLALVAEAERDAVAASTYGTGELIAAAVDAGASHVYVAAGGSATTDGGEGAVRALRERGWSPSQVGARLTVLCDVRTPFEQAARVFGPQKGASDDQVALLSDRLGRVAREYACDPRGVPMTAAAGGLAGGLWAEFDAELVSGAVFVLNAIGYDARMRAARAVVTGEGRLDRTSLVGKAVSEVATRARQAGVPCHAVVGANALEPFDARILDLQLVLEAGTLEQLEAAGAQIGELIDREHDRAR
jgi:glycerate 2-kinase